MFIDVDRFKVVNDSLGHEAGDWLLQQIGARLAQAVRATDSVARFGGDEFVILFDGVADEAMAMALTDRVRRELTRPFSLEGDEDFYATVSLGVALAARSAAPPSWCATPTPPCTAPRRRAGPTAELFDTELRHEAVERLRTERALRRALTARRAAAPLPADLVAGERQDRGGRGARALGATGAGDRAAGRRSCRSPRSAG